MMLPVGIRVDQENPLELEVSTSPSSLHQGIVTMDPDGFGVVRGWSWS